MWNARGVKAQGAAAGKSMMPIGAPAGPTSKYEFFDQFGNWTPITMKANIAELDKLESGSATTVTYTIGPNTYEVRNDPHANHEFMQKNLDPQFLTERQIRITSKHLPYPRVAAEVRRRKLQDVRLRIPWAAIVCKTFQFFGGLVLGCIKTKFCKKICV